MQVLAIVRGACLEGFLTGATKTPASSTVKKTTDGKDEEVQNPLYVEWVATDQQVLGFLLSSITPNILSQLTACKTAAEVWSVSRPCSPRCHECAPSTPGSRSPQ
jgi:hypothetical protein